MPPISPEGGWPLALARSLSVAALLSAAGALVFRTVVLPKLPGRNAGRHAVRVAPVSLAAALPLLLAWALLQAAALADTGADLRAAAWALPSVLGVTTFGHVWLAQAAAACFGLAALRWRPGAALLPAAAAVILQAGHSHASSMDDGPSLLLLSDVIHLLAAAAWLGGLLPLLLTVASAPPRDGALAARWFTPLGKACVVAMAATALYQGCRLVESLPGLIGTRYGLLALAKLALFGILVGFAVVNRHRLAPALLKRDPLAARTALVRSIAVQTVFGLAVVVAAGVLSNLPPSLHEQPIWPFPLLPSLVTVDEDPEFERIVVIALLELGGAALLLALALARRRFRCAAALLAAATAWYAAPDLRLLFVAAYPTSFYRSPTDFAATAIVQGAALYAENCAICHGASGQGDGPAATLAAPPADLTQAHLWAHSDGELFWWLTHGIDAPDGGEAMAMPGFAAKLDADDRWALIDFVRANNAGMTRRGGQPWPVPMAAPDLVATCPDDTAGLASLRGRVVRLVFGGAPPSASIDAPDLVTITVGPALSGCVAADPAVARAYAIVLGTNSLAGSDVLVDPNGWLRPGQPASPLAIRAIADNPLAAGAVTAHHRRPR